MQFADPRHIIPDHPLKLIKPLRIALLGYRSHPHVGGQGIYIKHLSRALTEIGHHVDVLSGPPYPELDPRVTLIKIPSLDLYSVFPNHIGAFQWRFLTSWTDFFEWLSMATGGFAEPYCFTRRVYQYLQQHGDYDVIHDNQSLGFGLVNIHDEVAPTVVTVHHPITQDLAIALQHESRWGHRLLLKRWYQFVKMQAKVARKLPNLITVSHCAKKDIIKAFRCQPSTISVIPNGIDTKVFQPRPEVDVIAGRLLTTTSSDQPLKGFSTLLKALQIARQKQPELHLRVIGQLQPKSVNRQLIEQLKLSDCISFRSGLSESELCREYAKAQLAVCPSLYEGFGLPALEAMACGVPLVCSDGGALPEVVGESGRLVPAGQYQTMATAIIELMQSDDQRQTLRELGRLRATSHFSWQRVAEKLTEYYLSVTERS